MAKPKRSVKLDMALIHKNLRQWRKEDEESIVMARKDLVYHHLSTYLMDEMKRQIESTLKETE